MGGGGVGWRWGPVRTPIPVGLVGVNDAPSDVVLRDAVEGVKSLLGGELAARAQMDACDFRLGKYNSVFKMFQTSDLSYLDTVTGKTMIYIHVIF